MRASFSTLRESRTFVRLSLLLSAGLLSILGFGLGSTPAAAQTFTFYEVIVPAGPDGEPDADIARALLKGGAGIKAAVAEGLAVNPDINNPPREGVLILRACARLEQTAAGLWEIDQTYPLRYAESYAPDGTPQDFTVTKVGIEARVRRVKTIAGHGFYHFSFRHRRLREWVCYGPDGVRMQPIFDTREVREQPLDEGYFDLELNQVWIMGGLKDEGLGFHYIVLETILEEESGPTPGSLGISGSSLTTDVLMPDEQIEMHSAQ